MQAEVEVVFRGWLEVKTRISNSTPIHVWSELGAQTESRAVGWHVIQ